MTTDSRLALFGGQPIVKDHRQLRIDWPIVSDDDELAVLRAFRNRDFSGRDSNEVRALENEFSAKFDGMRATAMSSGTAALHTALVALGVGSGDEVIVPSLTFVATALAVLHNHSIPVFADISPIDFNIQLDEIAKKITPRTKAVIVVHLHGFPADIRSISDLCRARGISLIEDVAQAPGASVAGKLLGTFGDASIFSLMSQKNVATCGECGVLLTRGLREQNRAEMTRIYGEIIRPGQSRAYNSFTLGWNYTLNPIQAAMARVQLAAMDCTRLRIQASARDFVAGMAKFAWVQPQREGKEQEAVFHFMRVRFRPEVVGYAHGGRFRRAIQDALNAEGLNVRHYQNVPVPGHPVFSTLNSFGGEVPWRCAKSEMTYRLEDYPNALNTIRETVVMGAIGSAPGYLLCEGTVERYLTGLRKIETHMTEILRYAESVEYREPWEEAAAVSDSFGAVYSTLGGQI